MNFESLSLAKRPTGNQEAINSNLIEMTVFMLFDYSSFFPTFNRAIRGKLTLGYTL